MRRALFILTAIFLSTGTAQVHASFTKCDVPKNLPQGQAWSAEEKALHQRKYDNCRYFNQHGQLAELYLNKPQEEASSTAAYHNLNIKFEAMKAGCREPSGVEATDTLALQSCTDKINDLERALKMYNEAPGTSPKGGAKAAPAKGGGKGLVKKFRGK